MNYLKSIYQNKHFWPIILILLAGLITQLWYKHPDAVLTVGDWGMQYNPEQFAKLFTTIWDDKVGLGRMAPNQLAYLLPYGLLMQLVILLGGSLGIFQRLIFYSWFVLGGLGIYWLAGKFTKKHWARLFMVGIFWFNPYSLQVIWHLPHGMIQSPYLLTPFIIALVDWLFRSQNFNIGRLLLVVLAWWLTATSGYVGINYPVIHWLLVGGWFIAISIQNFRIKNFRQFINNFKQLFVLIIVWLILNSFWLVPVVGNLGSVQTAASLDAIISNEQQLINTSVDFTNAIRMTGLWTIRGEYKQDPFYSWVDWYDNPLYQIATWLVFIGIVLSVLTSLSRQKERTLIFTLLFIWVCSVILVMGVNPPFGDIVKTLYDKLWFISAGFRAAFIKWGIPLAFTGSILAAVGWSKFIDITKKKNKISYVRIDYLFVGLLTVSILILAKPFIDGTVIYQGGKVTPGFNVVVPKEYEQLNNYLRQLPDNQIILPLPLSKTNKQATSWEYGYLGGYFLKWFSDRHAILNADTGEYSYEQVLELGSQLELYNNSAKVSEVTESIDKLGITYLIVLNDSNWEYAQDHSWYFQHNEKTIANFIKDNKDKLTKVKTFGNIDLYRWREGSTKTVGTYTQLTFRNEKSSCPEIEKLGVATISTVSFENYKLGSFTNKLPWSNYCYQANTQNFLNRDQTSTNWDINLPTAGKYKLITSADTEQIELIGKRTNEAVEIWWPAYQLQIGSQKVQTKARRIKTIALAANQKVILTVNNQLLSWDSGKSENRWQITAADDYEIVLYQTSAELNVPDANFDSPLNKVNLIDASLSDPGKPDLQTNLVNNSKSQKSIELTGGNRLAAFRLKSQNIKPGKSYLLNYAVENVRGIPGHAAVITRVGGETKSYRGELAGAKNMAAVFVNADSDFKNDKTEIYIYSNGRDQLSINRFNEFKLFELKAIIKATIQNKDLTSQLIDVQLPAGKQGATYSYQGTSTSIAIPNQSFDNTIGREEQIDASAASPGSPQFQLDWVTNRTEGKYGLQLTTNNHTQAVKLDTRNQLLPGKIYQISFDHRNLTGEPIQFAIIERGNQPNRYRYDQIEHVSEWSTYNVIYRPTEGISNTEFYFYNPYRGQKNQNIIDNLQVRELTPSPQFKLSLGQNATKLTAPQITVAKLSPVTYQVKLTNLTGPAIFSLRNAYNSQWNLFPVEQLQHPLLPIWSSEYTNIQFIVNDQINGWYIDPGEEKELNIVIQFSGQRYLLVGYLVTASGIILCVVVLLIILLRKTYRPKQIENSEPESVKNITESTKINSESTVTKQPIRKYYKSIATRSTKQTDDHQVAKLHDAERIHSDEG